MSSMVFQPETRQLIENNVVSLLNGNQLLMNRNTINSPRAVGDAVQTIIETNFKDCIPNNISKNINTTFARRAMADLAFEDIDNKYYIVDVKTHNQGTRFNMPNLTSVERLARFYGDNNNYFSLLLISYTIESDKLIFSNCKFIPIEMLDWNCLTIGALGWGQIQIANSNRININEKNTRKTWMLQLCDTLDIFYPNEICKITERVNHFKKIREYWEDQP